MFCSDRLKCRIFFIAKTVCFSRLSEMYLPYQAKCSSIVSHHKFKVFGWREVDKPFVSTLEFYFNKIEKFLSIFWSEFLL